MYLLSLLCLFPYISIHSATALILILSQDTTAIAIRILNKVHAVEDVRHSPLRMRGFVDRSAGHCGCGTVLDRPLSESDPRRPQQHRLLCTRLLLLLLLPYLFFLFVLIYTQATGKIPIRPEGQDGAYPLHSSVGNMLSLSLSRYDSRFTSTSSL
jgi:hypothetical protein